MSYLSWRAEAGRTFVERIAAVQTAAYGAETVLCSPASALWWVFFKDVPLSACTVARLHPASTERLRKSTPGDAFCAGPANKAVFTLSGRVYVRTWDALLLVICEVVRVSIVDVLSFYASAKLKKRYIKIWYTGGQNVAMDLDRWFSDFWHNYLIKYSIYLCKYHQDSIKTRVETWSD